MLVLVAAFEAAVIEFDSGPDLVALSREASGGVDEGPVHEGSTVVGRAGRACVSGGGSLVGAVLFLLWLAALLLPPLRLPLALPYGG